MPAESKYDLTQGSILDRLMLVALPIIGTQLLLMSYNLVDMFLLGRVGSDAVASTGLAGMYVWMGEGFLLLGKMGAEIGVSQNLGRRDVEAARKFSHSSILLALTAGLIYGVTLALFSERLIGFFHVREISVAFQARNYLVIVSSAVPAVFIAGAIAGTFTGAGNSRAPFLINACGLVLNAVLDAVFIFGFGMGVVGAAIATAISQYVACAASIVCLLKKRDRPFERFVFFTKINVNVLRQILKWTVPLCVVSFFFTFFTMFISRLAASFGAGAIAVYRVGSQIESICWLVGEGTSTSVAAFVGQNYGAGRWDRIKSGIKMALVSWCSWGVFVTFLMVFAGRRAFGFFLPDPALLDMGQSFLRILAICEVFGCLEAISFGTMRGLGETIPQFAVSISCNALRIPIAYGMSRVLGVDGVWYGVTITASMRGLFAFVWFYRTMKKHGQK
ncbi:MAG: MATE family efflux transporter [Synergistaceae bacterium]|nr:MATE family efflux transporter [Synergistaceae bacterium]